MFSKCRFPRWELIVWAYIKLFLANLLLIGTFFAWSTWYRDATPIVSTSLATVVAVLDKVVCGIFLYACNKKNAKALSIYHFSSQFFLGLVAALCVYEFVILIILLFDIGWMRFEQWIYILTNKITLFLICGVEVCIFILLKRLNRNKRFDQEGDTEYLFTVDSLYDQNITSVGDTIQYKEEKHKTGVFGA